MKYRTTRGFTLLEVMIAVLVLSLGLLGLASLQAYSMRNNQSANYRTQATNLAYQLLDMARSHRGIVVDSGGNLLSANYNVQALLSSTSTWSSVGGPSTSVPVYCTSTNRNPIACDRERWLNAVRTSLPQGRARTAFNPASGELTIEICWRDDRAAADAETETSSSCGLTSEGYGQPTVGPTGADWPNNAYWVRTRI